MQFRIKPHLATILGLLALCSAQSQASRHIVPAASPVQPPSAPLYSVPAAQPIEPPAVPNTLPARPLAPSRAARHLVVEGISIGGDSQFQLQVRTTAGVTPQAQVITGPDRLVIDVPGAIPGRALRNQTVNQGQVERVRVGLFSASPRVTRIVLDLNSPTSYDIQTDPSGFTVTLGAQPEIPADKPASDDGQTIGWVTTGNPAASAAASPNPFVISNPAPVPVIPSEVRVVGGTGQLEIHARNATLSEVLFQVEQQTGAEIAIPAGTEQQQVIGDFGPGAASEVLAELLNGSDLNFVVVGSANDPYTLRRVILTHKAPGGPDYIPADNTPPVADNAPLPEGPQHIIEDASGVKYVIVGNPNGPHRLLPVGPDFIPTENALPPANNPAPDESQVQPQPANNPPPQPQPPQGNASPGDQVPVVN